MRTERRRRLTVWPISRLLPNMVTIGGMCCGLSAIRFSLDNRFEIAVALLVAAAIIDGMDGRIARFLNSTSMFGAQLDSLSDFVCFGVSPVIVMYLWKLHELRGLGWAMVLFFTMCCALRLARFNTSLFDESVQSWQKKFFTGIPSPAGAMLALMPLVASFYTGFGPQDSAVFCVFWVALIAILMPSRIPTFAVKKIRINHEWVLPFMLASGLVIVLVVIAPWEMFTVCGLAYLAAIPWGVMHYRRLAKLYRSPAAPLSPDAISAPESRRSE